MVVLAEAVDKFVDASLPAEAQKQTLSSIIEETHQQGLIRLVEALGPYLISTNDSIRSRGTHLLSQTLASLSDKGVELNDGQKQHLFTFYLDRLDDLSSGGDVLHGVHVLVMRHPIPQPSLPLLITKLFGEVAVQALPQQARHWVYEIMHHLITTHTDKVCGSDAIRVAQGVVRAMDGERDPRNLLLSFKLHYAVCHHVLAAALALTNLPNPTVTSADLLEEVYDVVSCYYPIVFVPPKNDPFGITRDQLRSNLNSCLISTPLFATLTINLLIDKLASSRDTDASDLPIQSEALDFLRTTIEQFGLEAVCTKPEKLRDVLISQAAECLSEASDIPQSSSTTPASPAPPSRIIQVLDIFRIISNLLFSETTVDPAKVSESVDKVVGVMSDTLLQCRGCSPALTLGIVVPPHTQAALLRAITHAHVGCLKHVLDRCLSSVLHDIASTNPRSSSFAGLHAMACPAHNTSQAIIQELFRHLEPHLDVLGARCFGAVSALLTHSNNNSNNINNSSNNASLDNDTTALALKLHAALLALSFAAQQQHFSSAQVRECVTLWASGYITASSSAIRDASLQSLTTVGSWTVPKTSLSATTSTTEAIDAVCVVLPLWRSMLTDLLTSLACSPNTPEQSVREPISRVMDGFVVLGQISPASWNLACSEIHSFKQHIQNQVCSGHVVWVWSYLQVLDGLSRLLQHVPQGTTHSSVVSAILNGIVSGLAHNHILANIPPAHMESVVIRLREVVYSAMRTCPPSDCVHVWESVCGMVEHSSHDTLYHVSCVCPSLAACMDSEIATEKGFEIVLKLAEHSMNTPSTDSQTAFQWHVYLSQTVAVAINHSTSRALCDKVVAVVMQHQPPLPQHTITLAAWVMKGLVLKGDARSEEMLTWFCRTLLATPANASYDSKNNSEASSRARVIRDALCIVLQDTDVLTKHRGAKVKALDKQRAYTIMTNVILSQSAPHTPLAPPSLTALTALLALVPPSVVKMDIARLFEPCVLLAISSQDVGVREGALLTLAIAAQQAPQLVAQHLDSLVPTVLGSLLAPWPMNVRYGALVFLCNMASLHHSTTFPHKLVVYRAVASALDDKKRRIRLKAVECRNLWAILL